MADMQTPTRLPRFKRHRFRKPTFVLQERDREIIRLVADYRVITSEEIQALIDGSHQAILRRLQKLYHGGYLDRPRHQLLRGNSKMVYALGQRGAPLINQESDGPAITVDWAEKNRQIGLRYLEHGLMVTRFRTALTLAARLRGDVVIEKWRQDQELRDAVVVEHADHRERIPVCPDAYFALRLTNEPQGSSRIHVFLEADRSTMTLKRMLTKLRGYWHYWRVGLAEKRFGIRNFLVLTVTLTPERATNVRAITRQVDGQNRGLRMFLFGSADQYNLTEPLTVLNPIWTTSGDEGLHSLLE
jgi:hypothetical protein